MSHSRHHEQIPACRPGRPGRQAVPVRTAARAIALATAFLLAAALAPAPALGAAAETAPPSDRVHQRLSAPMVETAIRAAESKKGTPYGWGGTGPHAFDCSGLVQWSFRQAGVELPRIAHDQVAVGTRIPYSQARRGDLVYWSDSGGYVYHVGIYLGRGRMIDAPESGDHVRERDVFHHDLGGAVRL
ncbi:C40 family peptidase [Nocardiopsis sp. EMB25]|uniref:C40 family peptidase n=1 Tax=Nocardiopsis TaxID=2013 RepID=UPI0004766585|nr:MULTISPECIES: C40 family peptidase [Nocardiopsis]MCY9787386.1 C40 family peptidase [Nocardiopsis sp. EMB25]